MEGTTHNCLSRPGLQTGDNLVWPEGYLWGYITVEGLGTRGHLPLASWGKAKEAVGSAAKGTPHCGLVFLCGDRVTSLMVLNFLLESKGGFLSEIL